MAEYIKQLRKHVGSRPLVMVGAGVLVLDKQNRLLLVSRTDNFTWGIPGGALEPGEKLIETARRELKEETGLIAETLEMFEVFSGPEFYYKYPNGDEVFNIVAIFTCQSYTGTPKADGKEASAINWYAIDDLPGKLNPVDQIILENFRTLKKYKVEKG